MVTFADLFTGGGGAALGAKAAGLELTWGVELNPEIAEVAAHNLRHQVVVGDVLKLNPRRFDAVDVYTVTDARKCYNESVQAVLVTPLDATTNWIGVDCKVDSSIPLKTLFAHDTVEVRWSKRSKTHFVGLGYAFTAFGDAFTVKVTDLTRRSPERVEVVCPLCETHRIASYADISTYGHSYCNGCVKYLKFHTDLTGAVFGRLTVLERLGKHPSGKGYMWRCVCLCGNFADVHARNLVKGHTRSCGCLHPDVTPSQEAHYNWNPTITDEAREKRRLVGGYRAWRRAVRARANDQCEACGRTEKTMVAHHINSWHEYPEQRLETSNGACLCGNCHREFHETYGQKQNTRAQFVEFLSRKGAERV